MKYLITGGCGFLGSNLSEEILKRQHKLVILDNLSRNGTRENLAWLQTQGSVQLELADIRNAQAVEGVIKKEKPDVIFHLAGQVAMTTSLGNPREDFEINALGTLNLLEAVRLHSPHSTVLYSSTNKVYGDLETVEYLETSTRYTTPQFPNGFDESTPLDFRTPYGCSKGAADQYMLDYHQMFGLKTIVVRHSTMYGSRQFATFDQGWIGWFCQMAKVMVDPAAPPFAICGNGKQVRDILFADDVVRAYFSLIERSDILQGEVFNLGGGVENSLSLLELFTLLEEKLSIKMRYIQGPPRASDQKVFIADSTKLKRSINWEPRITAREGVEKSIEWNLQLV